MLDREIDRTIDEVAREMTAGEPAGDFRARVLARTEARRQYPLRTWQQRMSAAAAVALIVAVVAGVMAVMLLRGQKTGDQARSPERTAPQEAPSAPRIDGGPERAAQQQKAASPQRAPRHQADTPRRDVATQMDEVAALAPPRLDVESIALGELDPPPSIEIERLETIASIAIAPLAEKDQQQSE
jgi:hypothetical protein